MRLSPIIIFCILLQSAALAQRGQARENIEAAKIGLITKRLNLTADQSAKFWPLYNEYEAKKVNLRKSLRKLKKEPYDPATMTDAEAKEDLKEMLDLRQKEVDLEKEYVTKFMKVVSPKQVVELFKAEQEFNRLLLDRLEERRTNKASRQPGRNP